MNYKSLILDKKKLVLSALFVLLAIFGFVNIYIMSAIRSLYPIYLLMFVLVLSLLLLLSGIGLLLKKKWTLYTFFGFSLLFLALAFISQFGLLKQDWVVFTIIFIVLCALFALIGNYVKNCVTGATSKSKSN